MWLPPPALVRLGVSWGKFLLRYTDAALLKYKVLAQWWSIWGLMAMEWNPERRARAGEDLLMGILRHGV